MSPAQPSACEKPIVLADCLSSQCKVRNPFATARHRRRTSVEFKPPWHVWRSLLRAFPIAHRDARIAEVDVFYSQAHTFHKTQPAPVEQASHQSRSALQ